MPRWLLALTAALTAGTAHAQFVTFGSGGGAASITFDSLASAGTGLAWTNGTTVNGVYAFKSDSPQGAVPTYGAQNGGTFNSGLYSFGTTGNSERALGVIAGGVIGNGAFGIVVQNTSADTPLTISLGYTGEQWRNSGPATPAQHTTHFTFRTTATAPTALADWTPGTQTPAGYSDLNALDFTGPVAGTGTASAGPLDGNLSANRVVFGTTQVSTVNPGEYLVLRWFDPNDFDNDHGLGIDDVTITAVPVPEPSAVLAVSGAVVAAGTWFRRRH